MRPAQVANTYKGAHWLHTVSVIREESWRRYLRFLERAERNEGGT